jgi:hypothetical protein
MDILDFSYSKTIKNLCNIGNAHGHPIFKNQRLFDKALEDQLAQRNDTCSLLAHTNVGQAQERKYLTAIGFSVVNIDGYMQAHFIKHSDLNNYFVKTYNTNLYLVFEMRKEEKAKAALLLAQQKDEFRKEYGARKEEYLKVHPETEPLLRSRRLRVGSSYITRQGSTEYFPGDEVRYFVSGQPKLGVVKRYWNNFVEPALIGDDEVSGYDFWSLENRVI